ncbi:hypothetical protein GCM10007916_37730 [Psychromonas marina]|uniref:Tc1-like transposase DDE domain-containing protein n=1 Tax=Psychromonas marina TaxID=88364 RepID=A0ABQ6E6P6_9GAMM|nr:hypothetical protein GCM10007916_37730 [Psychromonas marina]
MRLSSGNKQQQYTYAYLFGAVCPSNGKTEAIIASFSNMEIMKEHLALIANATEADRHAVVIMDGASWHQEYLDDVFPNLSIIHIPAYSPELNPINKSGHGCDKMKLLIAFSEIMTIL